MPCALASFCCSMGVCSMFRSAVWDSQSQQPAACNAAFTQAQITECTTDSLLHLHVSVPTDHCTEASLPPTEHCGCLGHDKDTSFLIHNAVGGACRLHV